MIDVRELRIGNYLLGIYTEDDENGEEQEFTSVCSVGTLDIFDQTDHAIWVDGDAEREYYDEFRPIPLTEEWLLRFGFEPTYWENGELAWWRIDGKDLVSADFRLVFFNTKLEYVHQLQNIFYALGVKLILNYPPALNCP